MTIFYLAFPTNNIHLLAGRSPAATAPWCEGLGSVLGLVQFRVSVGFKSSLTNCLNPPVQTPTPVLPRGSEALGPSVGLSLVRNVGLSLV